MATKSEAVLVKLCAGLKKVDADFSAEISLPEQKGLYSSNVTRNRFRDCLPCKWLFNLLRKFNQCERSTVFAEPSNSLKLKYGPKTPNN